MSSDQKQISVKSKDAFNFFKEKLKVGEEKEFGELVRLLKIKFEGINYNQCSGIINRAHNPRKGNPILFKNGDKYSLITKEEESENKDGLKITKDKIELLILELEKIPASQFESGDSFNSYLETLNALKQLKKE